MQENRKLEKTKRYHACDLDSVTTCWQIEAYLARTFAFSIMDWSEGVWLWILSTQRHLAKPAPPFLYSAQRSARPSRPTSTSQYRNIIHHPMTIQRLYCITWSNIITKLFVSWPNSATCKVNYLLDFRQTFIIDVNQEGHINKVEVYP